MSEKRDAKQVIVIRKDLNMRKGKIASQAAHASMKVLLDRMTVRRTEFLGGERVLGAERSLVVPLDGAFESWLSGSFTKITVSVNSEKELLDLQILAENLGLPTALIRDEGRTEFGGVPTLTALAIGPAWPEDLDPITGNLPLL